MPSQTLPNMPQVQMVPEEASAATLKIIRTDRITNDSSELFAQSFLLDGPPVAIGSADGLGVVSAFSLLEAPAGKWLLGEPTIGASFADHTPIYEDDPIQFYKFPSEAQLFARDPEELAAWFETLPMDVPEILRQTTAYSWPGSLSILSPTAPPIPPNPIGVVPCKKQPCPPPPDTVTNSVDPVWPEDFFQPLSNDPLAQLGEAAGRPTGHGSIKAVKLQRPGWCTNEQFFTDYFGGVDVAGGINISQIINDSITNTCSSVDELIVYYLVGVPLIRHQPGQARDSRGQLFMTTQIYVKKSGFGCTSKISMIVDIGLNAYGELTFELATDANDKPLFSIVDVGGGGCQGLWILFLPLPGTLGQGIHDFIAWAAATLLPGDISAEALKAQSIPPKIALDNKFNTLNPNWTQCVPNPWNHQWGTTTSRLVGNRYVAKGDICYEARQDICNLIRRGLTISGRNPRALDWPMDTAWLDDPLKLGPGCTRFVYPNADELVLYSLFDAVERKSGVAPNELLHWNCMQTDLSVDEHNNFTGLDSRGQCYFTPPIKRMFSNLDGFQFVLFDSDPAGSRPEWHNASVAAWYALKGIAAFGDHPSVENIGNIIGDVDLEQYVCNYERGRHTSASTDPTSSTSFTREPVLFNAPLLFCPTTQVVGSCTVKDGKVDNPCQHADVYDPYDWNGVSFDVECDVTQTLADWFKSVADLNNYFDLVVYQDLVAQPERHPCKLVNGRYWPWSSPN